jgi:hypothetical protein
MRDDPIPGFAKVLAEVGLGHAARFASAIEMFEVLPDESSLDFVAAKLANTNLRAFGPVKLVPRKYFGTRHTSQLVFRFELAPHQMERGP